MLRIIAIVLTGAFGLAAAQPAHCALAASGVAAGVEAEQAAHASQAARAAHAAHAAHTPAGDEADRTGDEQPGDHERHTHDDSADCPVLTVCSAAALPTVASTLAPSPDIVIAPASAPQRLSSLRDLSADPPPPRTARRR